VIPLPANTRVWLAAGVTNMYRGFNTLSDHIGASIYKTFYVQRHLISRKTLRPFRKEAMNVWQIATEVA